MAYLYRHIRLDKNEPFYVGIGSDDKYKRAKTKQKRNDHWHNIVAKTNYRVDILLDDLTWQEACDKEVEFIKLYGRANLKKGILCNLTDGGDGQVGFVFSKESKDRMSESHKGQVAWNKDKTGVFSDETLKKMSESHKNISEETRNRMRIANSNPSLEKRKNMSKAQEGNKNASKPRSIEVKMQMSKSRTGKKRNLSKEKREELSNRMKGNKFASVKMSKERKLQQSKALKMYHKKKKIAILESIEFNQRQK